MAKPVEKKREKSHTHRDSGGSTLLGILIGLVLGLTIALGVAWYINKLPNPFKERAPTPKPPPEYAQSAPAPKVTAPDTPKPATAQETPPKAEKPAAATDAPEKKSTASGRETFFIQAGSFQDALEADNLKARLALLGVEASVQARNLPEKGVWHRVRAGPYSNVEEVNRIREILKQNNIESALVKVREGE